VPSRLHLAPGAGWRLVSRAIWHPDLLDPPRSPPRQRVM